MGFGLFKKLKDAIKNAGKWVHNKVIKPVVNTAKKVVTPDNIKKLPSLTYYGKLPTDYEKQAIDFNYDNHTYAGSDCSKQISDLQDRIDQKDHGRTG